MNMSADSEARKHEEVQYHNKRIDHLNQLLFVAYERYYEARRANDSRERALALKEIDKLGTSKKFHGRRIREITTRN